MGLSGLSLLFDATSGTLSRPLSFLPILAYTSARSHTVQPPLALCFCTFFHVSAPLRGKTWLVVGFCLLPPLPPFSTIHCTTVLLLRQISWALRNIKRGLVLLFDQILIGNRNLFRFIKVKVIRCSFFCNNKKTN